MLSPAELAAISSADQAAEAEVLRLERPHVPTRWKFPTFSVRHGTPARREFEFLYKDGTPRSDLAGAAGYFRVYSDTGSSLLFPEVALSSGSADHRRVLALTEEQTTQARSGYYAEIEFRDGSGDVIPDSGWYGTIEIAGK